MSSLCWDVEVYVKGCNGCLTLKIVWHKLYKNLQFLPIVTHCWKSFSIICFPLLINWKSNRYDVIIVIVSQLIKIIYYKVVKITINVLGLLKIIINIVMRYHSLSKLIISNYNSLFPSKFQFLWYYFLGLKWKLSTACYPQIDGQMKE